MSKRLLLRGSVFGLGLLAAVACAGGNLEPAGTETGVIAATQAALGASCASGCGTGQTCCDGACTDITTDPNHCGSCNTVCDASQGCCNSACKTKTISAGPLAEKGSVGTCSRLVYGLYRNQGESNRVNQVPDFSFAGYRGGGVRIPDAKDRESVSPAAGDDRVRIQDAINRVSALPLDAQGFRGAVLLKRGEYQISRRLTIPASGVVLRGEGQGADGTVIVSIDDDPDPIIEIRPPDDTGLTLDAEVGTRQAITTPFVPTGATTFQVASGGSFAKGDRVVVLRTPNQTWINTIRMNAAGFDHACTPAVCPAANPTNDACSWPWRTCDVEVRHYRTLAKVSGNSLTVDVPLVDTMEDQYGSGVVYKITPGTRRVEQSGVERLRLDTVFTSPTDEAHAGTGVLLYRASNSWVRKVTVLHTSYAAVDMQQDSNFNTVEEVAHVDPISVITGARRYSFNVGRGTGNLFQRCYARNSRHSFVTNHFVAGPNVWLDCLAVDAHEDAGPHQRWATGLLFDNVKALELHVENRKDAGSGHGWSGAQVMFWNPEASSIVSDAPPTAMNWVKGPIGVWEDSDVTPNEPSGMGDTPGAHVSPRSLYLQQLRERMGKPAVNAVTTQQQRNGAIFGDLSDWAGDGELFPDPECDTGIIAGDYCCAAACLTCGGVGCAEREGGGSSCCTRGIEDSQRSCSEYGPPCVIP